MDVLSPSHCPQAHTSTMDALSPSHCPNPSQCISPPWNCPKPLPQVVLFISPMKHSLRCNLVGASGVASQMGRGATGGTGAAMQPRRRCYAALPAHTTGCTSAEMQPRRRCNAALLTHATGGTGAASSALLCCSPDARDRRHLCCRPASDETHSRYCRRRWSAAVVAAMERLVGL
ncbi:hypothetical protein VPH35_078844 [Triticum aestivum]